MISLGKKNHLQQDENKANPPKIIKIQVIVI